MQAIGISAGAFHISDSGPRDATALAFSNSLGTDFRIWDRVVALLPQRLRILRYDARGHGLSPCPPGPWTIDDLAADLAAILDGLGLRRVVICGLSIGGMTAQALAVARPDLVEALILSDTAAKIGTPEIWAERIAAVEAGGVEALADAVLARWFPPAFHAERPGELALWRAMLTRTPLAGYVGCAAAIRDADLAAATATIRAPTLAIVGEHDGSTPPALVRETAALIPGAACEVVAGAGHLPCVDRPEQTAALIEGFLRARGLVAG